MLYDRCNGACNSEHTENESDATMMMVLRKKIEGLQ